jgi:hypothetical protein
LNEAVCSSLLYKEKLLEREKKHQESLIMVKKLLGDASNE